MCVMLEASVVFRTAGLPCSEYLLLEKSDDTQYVRNEPSIIYLDALSGGWWVDIDSVYFQKFYISK